MRNHYRVIIRGFNSSKTSNRGPPGNSSFLFCFLLRLLLDSNLSFKGFTRAHFGSASYRNGNETKKS